MKSIDKLYNLVMKHGVVSGRTSKVIDLQEPIKVEVVNPSGYGTRSLIVHSVFTQGKWGESCVLAQCIDGETFYPGNCIANDFNLLLSAVEQAAGI